MKQQTLHAMGVLREPSLLYPVLLALLGACYLLRWPVMKLDTDTWFYLDNGRYLFAHHAIPHTSYFSFLSPPREWVNYSWLFQVLLYGLYLHAGYYGLILLRGAVYLATALLIFRLLFHGRDRSQARWWDALVAVLCQLLLLPRNFDIRPHIFTYFFIVLFLYVIECKRAWVR